MLFLRILSRAVFCHPLKTQAYTRLLITVLSSLGFLLSGCSYETTLPTTGTVTRPTVDPASAPATKMSTLVLPPQGLYDSCVPSSPDCIGHLDTLAAEGFRIVLNYGLLYGRKQDLLAYADHAAALSMQVIWPLSYRAAKPEDWMVTKYKELGSDSHCGDNLCMIRYVVGLVKNHPSTWGYYVADEVKPEEYSRMKPWTDLIKQLDPNHPRLFVTAGSNDPMEQYYGFYSYMRDLADVFGPDYYPYGYVDAGGALTRFTGATANHAQYWADTLGGQSVMVLQACSLSRYAQVPLCMPWPHCAPFPSTEQMKAQRDQTLLSAHPTLILWWTYADILKTDDPEKHLADLAAAAFAPLPDGTSATATPSGACPQGWHCDDVGNPTLKGAQSVANGTWLVSGAGWDIWAKQYEQADQFHYVWRQVNGELSAEVRAMSQLETDRSAKAGIMFRKSIDPVSPYYAVYVTPESGVRVQYRTDYGLESRDASWAIAILQAPIYLKIERHGTTFRAYSSADGNHWTNLYNSTIDIPSLSGSLMAGMAVTSRNEAVVGSATFTNVAIP